MLLLQYKKKKRLFLLSALSFFQLPGVLSLVVLHLQTVLYFLPLFSGSSLDRVLVR